MPSWGFKHWWISSITRKLISWATLNSLLAYTHLLLPHAWHAWTCCLCMLSICTSLGHDSCGLCSCAQIMQVTTLAAACLSPIKLEPTTRVQCAQLQHCHAIFEQIIFINLQSPLWLLSLLFFFVCSTLSLQQPPRSWSTTHLSDREMKLPSSLMTSSCPYRTTSTSHYQLISKSRCIPIDASLLDGLSHPLDACPTSSIESATAAMLQLASYPFSNSLCDHACSEHA